MSYRYSNQPNRRRPVSGPVGPGGQTPTLADYQALAQAYEEVKARLEQQAKELQNTKSELQIKNEALHRQSEDFKKVETELLFTRAGLEEAQRQLESDAAARDWEEKYIRLQAEVDNLRKRWEQRAIADSAENRRKVLTDMLPLADHLDLAMQHAPESHSASVKSFVANIEATRRAFLETLRRYGVERIDPLGEPFDPNLHEAVGHAPSDEVEADHISQVLQAGYREGDRLLRPARVLVNG